MKQTEVLTHVSHVVYMTYMSQILLCHASNLFVLNFRIFLLMYPGSLSCLPAVGGHGGTPAVPGDGLACLPARSDPAELCIITAVAGGAGRPGSGRAGAVAGPHPVRTRLRDRSTWGRSTPHPRRRAAATADSDPVILATKNECLERINSISEIKKA